MNAPRQLVQGLPGREFLQTNYGTEARNDPCRIQWLSSQVSPVNVANS
jgi:hypothetical protein